MPKHPGPARWLPQGSGRMVNKAIFVAWPQSGDSSMWIGNKLVAAATNIKVAPFSVTFRNGTRLSASSMKQIGAIHEEILRAEPASPCKGDQYKGIVVRRELRDAASGLDAALRVELRDDSNYVREAVTLKATTHDLDVSSLTLIDTLVPESEVVGSVPGSPVASKIWFMGVEHPMSESEDKTGHAKCWISRKLPIHAGQSATYSAMIGVAPEGQLRRAFQRYVERERAHPYRPFLHYNSWYDLGYFNRYTAPECVDVIHRFGQELREKRGVKLSSFLFDDGWDDTDTTWKFNSGFPEQFKPLAKAAEKYGADPGIWLSPWGGYGDPRDHRLAAAKKNGYEIDSEGLALSGPRYYKRFHDVCLDLLKQGINQFKFDGTGSPDKQYPGSAFDSDFDAAISLIADLRRAKPALFVNLTTGTWPSPFWTRYADSIWRGGEDHTFAGVGTKREQWMTYRDGDTYRGIVQKGPLYPINSLMLHGLIYARYAGGLKDDPGNDFARDVEAYFGTGTQLQEMYITPKLLTKQNWDDLAKAAKWSAQNPDILKDVHWIGGDPIKLEVYGHAAWNGKKAIIQLRNPSDKPQTYMLDIAKALELPASAPKYYLSSMPFSNAVDQIGGSFSSGKSVPINLQPFQIYTWDLTPRGK